MSLTIGNGKMRITKGSQVRFDSDDRLFHITNTVQGSVDIAAVGNKYQQATRLTTTWDLGAVHAAATQIMGAVKFTLNNNAAGMAYDRWHALCGGSICWLMDGEPQNRDYAGANLGLRQAVFYNFDIVNARARLVRELFLDVLPGSTSYVVREHRLTYKLKCGVWV